MQCNTRKTTTIAPNTKSAKMLNGSAATTTAASATGDNRLHVDAPLLLDGNLRGNGLPVGGNGGSDGAAGGRQLIVSVGADGANGGEGGAVGGGGGGGRGDGRCEDGRRPHLDASWTLLFHQANLRKSFFVLAAVFLVLGTVIGGIAVLLIRYPECELGEFKVVCVAPL